MFKKYPWKQKNCHFLVNVILFYLFNSFVILWLWRHLWSIFLSIRNFIRRKSSIVTWGSIRLTDLESRPTVGRMHFTVVSLSKSARSLMRSLTFPSPIFFFFFFFRIDEVIFLFGQKRRRCPAEMRRFHYYYGDWIVAMVTAWRKPLWLVVACFFFHLVFVALCFRFRFSVYQVSWLADCFRDLLYYSPPSTCLLHFPKKPLLWLCSKVVRQRGLLTVVQVSVSLSQRTGADAFFSAGAPLIFWFKVKFYLKKKKSDHVTWCVPSARFLEVPSDLLKLFQICLCVIWWKNRIYNVPPGLFAPLPVLEVSPARPGFSFSSFVPIEILLQFQEVGRCVRCHFPFDSLKTGNLSPAEMWRW